MCEMVEDIVDLRDPRDLLQILGRVFRVWNWLNISGTSLMFCKPSGMRVVAIKQEDQAMLRKGRLLRIEPEREEA
jgi:hypothetical protein